MKKSIIFFLVAALAISGCEVNMLPDDINPYEVKEVGVSLCDDGYSWYSNGDKSVKMEHVIYGQNTDLFPDSIVHVITFDLDWNPIVLFKDVLHNCYNWNDYMYEKGYNYDDTFNVVLFNKNKEQVVLSEYNSQPKLKY